jgi:hypothetical protein
MDGAKLLPPLKKKKSTATLVGERSRRGYFH